MTPPYATEKQLLAALSPVASTSLTPGQSTHDPKGRHDKPRCYRDGRMVGFAELCDSTQADPDSGLR